MNLRCSFCQTPYTIGRVEKLDALQHMEANNLTHYDAHCPRCRKATPVQRQKLELTMPNWREALKELEKEMSSSPQPEAPLSQPVAADSAPQADAASESTSAKHHRVRASVRAREAAKVAAEKAAAKPKAKKAPAKKKAA